MQSQVFSFNRPHITTGTTVAGRCIYKLLDTL